MVNITEGTLSIAPDKLQSIYHMCCQVSTKKPLSKKSYQSLIGKLIYIHKCVAPARTFINRILSLFKTNPHKSRIQLTQDFFRDIQWFLKFLPAFNGVTFSENLLSQNWTHYILTPVFLDWEPIGIIESTHTYT